MTLDRKRGPARRNPPEPRCRTYCRRAVAFLFSHVGLCALVVGYSVVGALTFQALEDTDDGGDPRDRRMVELRNDTVAHLWEITMNLNVLYPKNWTEMVAKEVHRFQRRVVDAVMDGYDGKEMKAAKWSFSGAFLYSLTVITTIGYGNLAPRTEWGKVVTIIYAIFGIPLMLLYLTNIGDILAKAFRYMYGRCCACQGRGGARRSAGGSLRRRTTTASENFRVHHVVASDHDKFHEDEVRIEALPEDPTEELPATSSTSRVHVPIHLCLFIMASYISGGAAIFYVWEQWTILDAFYFCFVSLSTIGFGDLVPGGSVYESNSQEKLIICSLYLLMGMALIAMCFNLMQEEVIHKVRTCLRHIGIIKATDDDDDGYS